MLSPMKYDRSRSIRALAILTVVCHDVIFVDRLLSGGSAYGLGPISGAAGYVALLAGALLFCAPAFQIIRTSIISPVGSASSGLCGAASISGAGMICVGSLMALNTMSVGYLILGCGLVSAGSWALVRAQLLKGDSEAKAEEWRVDVPGRRWIAGLALLGLFSWMSMPMGCGKERAYLAAMKSDLRNLAAAQNAVFARTGRFARLPFDEFSASASVLGPMITLTDDGWIGQVAHRATRVTCVIYEGSTGMEPASEAGVPTCTAGPPRVEVRWALGFLGWGLLLAAAGVWLNRQAANSP